MTEAQILVAVKEKVVQVRVIGRATFKVSRELREYGIRAINKGALSIVIDLSSCAAMDSTFMGVLAMIGIAAKDKAAVIVVNASENHRRLLDGIGISRLFRFAEDKVENVTWENLCKAASGAAGMGDMADTVIAAHQTLMELDPENVPKFKDVVEMLSLEVEQMEHQKEGEV